MESENKTIRPAKEVRCMLVGKCMPKLHLKNFDTGKFCYKCKYNEDYYNFTVLNENTMVNEWAKYVLNAPVV